MSETPVFDSINAVYVNAYRVGEMTGRQEMKREILAILKRSKHVSPTLHKMLLEIEKLSITGRDHVSS